MIEHPECAKEGAHEKTRQADTTDWLDGWARKQLETIAESRSFSHGEVIRAKKVLMAAEGMTNTDIAREVGLSIGMVGIWRRRFLTQGVEGLRDEPRPRHPRSIEDQEIAEVIQKTICTKPKGETHWSCRSMARATGLSKDTINRHIDANVPKDLDIHLIVDNYATHKSQTVRDWLAKKPRYHDHSTPTYASWLNQVETWFGIIRCKAIRRGTFHIVKDLVFKIARFVKEYNTHCKPFGLHPTADSILGKVKRLCDTISET